ncbi:hypothetical protein D3C84_662150 [compost metagenome]
MRVDHQAAGLCVGGRRSNYRSRAIGVKWLCGAEHRRGHAREHRVGSTEQAAPFDQVVERPVDGAQSKRHFGIGQQIEEILTSRVGLCDQDLLKNELKIGFDESGHFHIPQYSALNAQKQEATCIRNPRKGVAQRCNSDRLVMPGKRPNAVRTHTLERISVRLELGLSRQCQAQARHHASGTRWPMEMRVEEVPESRSLNCDHEMKRNSAHDLRPVLAG